MVAPRYNNDALFAAPAVPQEKPINVTIGGVVLKANSLALVFSKFIISDIVHRQNYRDN